MKYAVIADIHGNLAALKAVLADSEGQGCGSLICLGDVVGQYQHPKECVEMIRARATACVKGNFDEWCSAESLPEGFNPEAAKNVEWTRLPLGEENRDWLGCLRYVETVNGFMLVHGTLNEPQRWGYAFDRIAAAASFACQTTNVCFFGHTHIPVAFVFDGNVKGGTFSKFSVEPGRKYFVNPGSVGQPRDNNPKAAYVVYDDGRGTVELRRVSHEPDGGDSGGIAGAVPQAPGPNPRLANRTDLNFDGQQN